MDRGSALFYGSFYSGAGDADRRAEFVTRHVGPRPGRVIDTAAGVGDLAFRLAAMGHVVVALESCGPMYAVLLDRCCRQPAIRHLVAPFPIDLEACQSALHADLVIASNHWSHLDAPGREALLRHAFRQLSPGGAIIINCAQETSLRSDQPWGEINRRIFGDLVIRHLASSTRVAGRPTVRVRFDYVMEYLGVPVHTEPAEFLLALDTPASATSLLTTTGYEKILIRGGFADTDYDPELPGFVVVARKPISE